VAWSLGISGRPKQFLGDVPLDAIATVDSAPARFGSHIRIRMRSGTGIDLEALRGEAGEEFGERLRRLTGRS
jgi:hypothetical protein